MKIATITFARSTKCYDYVITKDSDPVIAGKEYNIVIGASLKGPCYAAVTIKEVREVVSLPFNVKTSLHVDNNTMISRRLTDEEIRKLRNRVYKPKKKETSISSKPVVKKSISTDKKEEGRRRLNFLEQFEREYQFKQDLIKKKIENSRIRRK